MSDHRYDSLRQICINLSLNDSLFSIFKEDVSIRSIIETVTDKFGNDYNKLIDWEKLDVATLKICDDMGYSTPQETFHPTTLRYIFYAQQVLQHMSKFYKSGDKIRIIEIGGGYAGQAVMTLLLNKMMNYNFDLECHILDLNEVQLLQKRFATEVGKKLDITFPIFYTDIQESVNTDRDMYLVSNYALGEFYKDMQQLYIDNVVAKVKHGYVCWNYPMGDLTIHPYMLNLKDVEIFDENPQTNCPGIFSKIIRW